MCRGPKNPIIGSENFRITEPEDLAISKADATPEMYLAVTVFFADRLCIAIGITVTN